MYPGLRVVWSLALLPALAASLPLSARAQESPPSPGDLPSPGEVAPPAGDPAPSAEFASPGDPAASADSAPGEDIEEISLENLMDMVVTATLREQSTLDAPASIQVVTAADIRARGYRTLKQIMNDVPGFNDVSDTNEEVAAVRGVFTSTTNKILTLVNGHRMNDLMLGRYNTDQFLGLESVERIEFIRGPASALYGSGALVGIVNIITKKGADVSGTQLEIQGGIEGQEVSASWGRQLVGYDVFFNFTYLDAQGQTVDQPAEKDRAPDGQDQAPGKIYLGRYRQNLSGLFTIRSENSALALRAAHFRRATPRGGNGSFYDYGLETLKPAYTENDIFADYKYTWNLGKNRLTFNPSVHYFSYYEQSFVTFGVNRVGGSGTRSGTYGEYANYQLKLTFERQVLETLNLIAGLDGLLANFIRSDAVSATAANPNVFLRPNGYTELGTWFLGGAFAQAVFTPWKPLAITVGGRFDTFQDEADPRVTPRAGLVYKPIEALAIKLLYGQSYLAPMWAHTRANDGNYFVDPNLKLEPETFTGFDVVVAYGDKKASATVDLFYNQVHGLINGVSWVAPTPDTPAPCLNGSNCIQYRNSADSAYFGAEISAEGQILPALRLIGSYAFIAPDLKKDGDGNPHTSASLLVGGEIKNIPEHTFRYGLRLDPWPGLSLSVWGRAYLETPTDDPITGDTTIDAVALFDASAMYTWRWLTLQLIGRNLTDQYYERGGAGGRPLAREGLTVEGVAAVKF